MKPLFWAHQKAEEIVTRRKYRYLDKTYERDKYIVKTSASISGALHIGRLSDSIRGDAVVRAISDMGKEVEFIWVAEDMDPLRRIPEGVPANYAEYIGCPVSRIPDPWGCHSSYAEHHVSAYFEVLQEFVSAEMKRYSMREEYGRGSFKKFIQALLRDRAKVVEIQNRYRERPLESDWIPWTPICDNCGKIITPRVKLKGERAVYVCKDYRFEQSVAAGCGHEGEKDPLRDEGKLMWKSEWAAQWARWKVSAEGAGKEYVVPSSAWWINSEITERIFDYPSPTPIFYEHIMIEGKKMSASLGNVIYPKDWLDAAPPQLLRFFYNKKLMKTRSFSWGELPKLYDEYDHHARVYHGLAKVENPREAEHDKALYAMAQIGEPEKPVDLSFSHAVLVAQIFKANEDRIASLKRSGHYSEEQREELLRRMEFAERWAQRYAPADARFDLGGDVDAAKSRLTEEQRKFLGALADELRESTPEEIQNQIYELAGSMGLPKDKAFNAVYLAILGRDRGPKAGSLIASLDLVWTRTRLKEMK